MVAFVHWAVNGVDLHSLWNFLLEVSITWVLVIAGTTIVTLLLRAWRWLVLMRPFAPEVNVVDASRALAICYAGNFFVPRSGELLRALSLKWSKGTSISSILGTVVVERILDMISLVFFVGISILLLSDRLFSAFTWLGWVSATVLAGCAIALIGLVLVSVYRDRALLLVERAVNRVSNRLARTVVRFIDTFLQGITALHTPSAYLEIFVSSVLLNLGYIVIIYQGFASLNLDVGWEAALVVMALAAIGMIVPSFAGGSGSYHYFFKTALIVLYGIPAAPALACATVVHGVANITYLLLGVPAFLLQRRRIPADDSPESTLDNPTTLQATPPDRTEF